MKILRYTRSIYYLIKILYSGSDSNIERSSLTSYRIRDDFDIKLNIKLKLFFSLYIIIIIYI